MQNARKKDYIVKGNKFSKPLPPIGYNNEEEDAQSFFLQIMRGNINVDNISDPQPREVRIFLSSTFSDFKIERDQIIKKVIPEIESTCNSYGLDLRFCDMRWGVTDSAVNEHMVEKLCINEIEICRRNSIGPFFVLLIGNRYGYRPVPSEMPSSEYEMLFRIIEETCPKEIEIFTKWFKKDENAEPNIHILLPIKCHLPYYADYSDDVKRRESGNEWWSIEERIRRTLAKVSKIACDKGDMRRERRQQLLRSVTETELWSAVTNNEFHIDKGELDRCVAYERQLLGLMEDLQSECALKYIDYVKVDDKFVSDRDCLSSLYDFKKKMKKAGLTRNRQISVPWSPTGISEVVVTHQHYLDKLCTAMVKDLRELINARMATLDKLKNRFDRAKNNLQSEVINHWLFCRQRSLVFCGRQRQLEVVLDLIANDYGHPIIVYGDSGIGKTAFLSKVASQLQMESLKRSEDVRTNSEVTSKCFTANQSPVIILRFLGTSASSSTLQQLLFSVCFQIQLAYQMRVRFRKMTSLSSLQWLFNNLMTTISRKYSYYYPLILILDSLDQLIVQSAGIDGPIRKYVPCSWIPTETPTGVHIVISVATDPNKLHLFESLTDRLRSSKDDFIKMDCFQREEVNSILETMLKFRKRRLKKEQLDFVINILSSNPQALFIKMTVDEILNWTSFLPESEWSVANTIQSAIHLIFSRLENRYGKILIGYLLGYMTLGLNGLSEREIEDLLSMQDLVLNEIYQYHDPPIKGIIRLPSLLWARIHADLLAYIVEKRTDGKLTMSWYHRHLHQCALDRYVIEPGCGKQLHTDLANYFSMTSSCRRTCVLKNNKRTLEIKDANRLISSAPISDKQPRKLHAMPHHLIESDQSYKLIEDCVANLHYLICYLQCFGIQELIMWLKSCADIFPDNHTISIIKNCVVFIEPLLELDHQHLPGQILGQLHHLDRIVSDLNKDIDRDTVSLLTSLYHQCTSSLALTPCLVPSIACFPSCLGSIKLYKENIERIVLIPWNPSLVILISHQKNEWVVRLFHAVDRATMCSITCENRPSTVAVPNVNKNYIFIQDSKHILMFDIDTGQLEAKHSLCVNNKFVLSACMSVDGQGRWIAIASQDRIALLEYKPTTIDKSPLSQKYLLTVREVDTTTNMCFIQVDRHALLLTAHNYHSKTKKNFLVKLWQYEQNNQLWSIDLMSLSNKYSDEMHLWPVPNYGQQSEANESSGNHNGSTLVILPNGSCFMIGNIFDIQSLKTLIVSESSKANKDVLRSLSSDGDTVTITTTSACQTLVHTVDKQGSYSTVNIPTTQVYQRAITCAMVHSSTRSLLIGCKDGNLLYTKDDVTVTWRAHRSSVDYLSMIIDDTTGDIMKLITFSTPEKVLKCWNKHRDSSLNNELFSRTIFEEMNAFAYSSTTNSFVIVDSNCSSLYCGIIDNIFTDIKRLPIALNTKQNPDSESESNSKLVIDMEIVFNDQGVLIFFDDQIQLFNMTKSEVISCLNLPHKSSNRFQRHYWHVIDNSITSLLLLLTYDTSTSYFHLNFHRLPSIGQVISSKLFLAPVNMSHPHSQLEKIALVSSSNRKFLIVLWRSNKLSVDISIQDPSSLGVGDSFLCSSLNLKDSSQTLCFIPSYNLEESQKFSSRKLVSKVSSQTMFSYAIPSSPIPDVYPSDLMSESIILIGGLGEILVWDLESGSCKIPKVPNFHTWFKHSVTIITQVDVKHSSDNGILSSDMRSGKRHSLSDSNSKDFQKYPITALLISHQCALVVSGCGSGYIIVWRWTATLALCGAEPESMTKYRIILPRRHSAQVNCLALTRDLRLLASGAADMAIHLWNITNNSFLHQITIHCNPISLAFHRTKDYDSVSEESESIRLTESFLVCHSIHVGQNRMMLFDVIGLDLTSSR